MPVIDFTEIPPGNKSGTEQDIFELFARDFFSKLGYQILNDPSRGADGGKDLVIGEEVSGKLTKQIKKWLVSCKHYAGTGSSVSKSDESDLRDRLEQYECTGFMAFYSTLPSSGLATYFEGLKPGIDIVVYDREKIESEIVVNSDLREHVAKRYFPKSYEKLIAAPSSPVVVGDVVEPLLCCHCGKDLLESAKGVFCLVRELRSGNDERSVVDAYWACYGNCDLILRRTRVPEGCYDTWESISDLAIPYFWLKYNQGIFSDIASGQLRCSPKAVEQLIKYFGLSSQLIARETTSEQFERVDTLRKLSLLD